LAKLHGLTPFLRPTFALAFFYAHRVHPFEAIYFCAAGEDRAV
jgi:hypothetical protein